MSITTQPTLVRSGESFRIISFRNKPNGSRINEPSFIPHSVERLPDVEVFTIGDHVTNGTQMHGTITGFSLLEGKIFVEHTWSGVGMNLDSLSKVIELPSQFQVNQVVEIKIPAGNIDTGANVLLTATVRAVHFHIGKVRYDVDVWMKIDGEETTTRIHNVDSVLLSAV